MVTNFQNLKIGCKGGEGVKGGLSISIYSASWGAFEAENGAINNFTRITGIPWDSPELNWGAQPFQPEANE